MNMTQKATLADLSQAQGFSNACNAYDLAWIRA